jgi:glycerol-3-phosphate cytidylyltransferase
MSTVKIGNQVLIGPNVEIDNNEVFEKRNKWNMKVGFTCGAFDVLHTGHVLMLEEAKSVCDYLIVGVQSDPNIDRPGKNTPVQSYEERIITVKAIKYVDEIVLYDTEDDLVDLLTKLKPDIRILGADWQGKKYTGCQLPIEPYFNSRNHNYSSSSLRKRIMLAELGAQNEPYEMP